MPERARPGVAIVGMAARFPGAPDLDAYRRNLEAGVDAISLAPPSRWDPSYYDPASSAPDRLYARRGGFLAEPVTFDALAFGIMPVAAEGAEPDQLLALDAASRALADAGYDARPFDRERASVIVGRGGYLTPGVARLDQRVRVAEQLAASLRALVPGLDEAQIARAKDQFTAALPPFGGDTAIGLVPNLAASRIANRLDLGGAAYTVDAACASALVAVDQAARELEDGRADLVIAGGVHLCHDATFWSVFCQLGALSRSETIRPFDRRADGLLIGEGVGMIVLRRLADAERDGDRIYAVVRGTGVASDGRGASLMTPAVEGQVRALRRAWDRAEADPASVGLVEAHGTGTSAGDAAEIETLRRFFGEAEEGRPRAALGSVKSMIGHAMPAAGIAGLIKAALAVHGGVLLPSLHCEEPRDELARTRFRVPGKAEPWEAAGGPRRAGVNAFGFGGINAHVVLEEHAAARAIASAGPRRRPLLLAAETRDALLSALDGDGAVPSAGACRLALFDPTPERRAKARAIVARGEPWRGRDDVWFAPRGLAADGGKIAFLFPGVDASFKPRVDDVAARFGLPWRAAAAAGDLKGVGMAIIATGRILDAALSAIGIRAEAIAGHSIGEWSGIVASGMVSHGQVDALIESLATEDVEVPGVAFVAAGCGADKAARALEGLADIAVSHDNCPHQIILCGREESAAVAMERLSRMGVLCQKLPFRSGYHSPLFADFVGPHRRVLSRLEIAAPRTPLWSATTCAPYPSDAAAVRRLAIDHLVRPVRFRELTEALWAEGFRIFVQVGSGSLVGFVSDTLRGRPHLAIAANVAARPGLAQLERVAAALFVEGAPVSLDELDLLPEPAAPPSLPVVSGPKAARSPVVLALGAPLVTAAAPLALPGVPGAHDMEGLEGPVAAELVASFADLAAAERDVAAAFRGARAPKPARGPRKASYRVELSVETYPELHDHAFYRQPPGWPSVADRYPVVPMTMLLELMMDAAAELVPELAPVGLSSVRALRWLAVAPPVEAQLDARWDGEAPRVEVSIDGFASGVVELAAEHPAPPPADVAPLAGKAPARVTPAELYEGRWMFHGPDYQGVIALGPVAKDGIQGTLVTPHGRGALLDNAGQLLGYWVMEHAEKDRLAMPVLLERVRFFGPAPRPGERLDCTVRIRSFDDAAVRADVELVRAGAVWARIEGWEDRRFDTDERVWAVLRFPERNALSTTVDRGVAIVTPPWRGAASRDLLARRYLGEREREELAAVGLRRQASWLLGRIAIKDAARRLLWEGGHGPIFPVEIEVETGADGRPVLRGPLAGRLCAAVAEEEGIAAAVVSEGRAGVAIERVGAREDEARALAAGRVAGLAGEVSDGVETRREGDYIIGWTCT